MSTAKDRTGKTRNHGDGVPNIDAVKPLIAEGFVPIPLHRYNAKDQEGRELGKRPRNKDWTTRDYGDPLVTLKLCRERGWNVGIRVPGSYLVLDIDVRAGGDDGFVNLCADFGLDPTDWPCVRTGSGGRHYFLRKAEGVKVLDTLAHEDDGNTEKRYRGCEFKSRGRQMVAPGSWHPNGRQYDWESFDWPPVFTHAIPENLLDAITRPDRPESVGGGHVSPEQLAHALEGLDPCDFQDHDTWLHLMMAAHHATGGDGRQEWIDFSTGDPEYRDHGDMIGRRWDSLHADHQSGFTAATINMHLHEAGRPDLCFRTTAAEDFADDSDDYKDGDAFVGPAEDEFESDFDRDKKGKIVATSQANIRLAIDKLGARVSYNLFSDRILIEGLKDFGPYLDDAALDRLWLKVDEEFRFRPSQGFFVTVVMDYARRLSFHPVRDYFKRVQAEWDGKPRLDRLLIDYAGATDSAYVRAVSALPLIASVRRVRSPGAKYDEAVVMESEQGKQKSTFLATLAIKSDWFTDSLPLHANQKETIEFTAGKLIVEFADLHGLKKADIDQVKAQLSRVEDRARLAYGRLQAERPRQWIPWGTANNDTYLRDQTGNRRFWPVKINNCDIPKLKRDLDQIWGEAAHREAAGESIRLPRALYADATAEQVKRLDTKNDPFTDALRSKLGEREGKIASEDVWRILGMPTAANRTQHHNERMGAAMKYLGWKKGQLRIEGHRVSTYRRGKNANRWLCTEGRFEDLVVKYADESGDTDEFD